MRDNNYLHIKSSLLMPINACKHALLCNLMTHTILKVTYSKVDVLLMCKLLYSSCSVMPSGGGGVVILVYN